MMKFAKAIILSTGLASLTMPALADEKTEQYVATNADMALKALNNSSLSSEERRAEFNRLMTQFTDLDYIVLTVLDKYYSRFTKDELKEFTEAFHQYALATYEAELDKYRGNAIEVTSSKDYPPSAKTKTFSDVTSVIDLPDTDKDLTVIWRVVEFNPKSRYAEVFGSGFKVTDVALVTDGGTLWLAQNQKEQFQALLGRNNGDAKELIAKVREMTERLNETAAQKRAALNSAEPDANKG